jgi:hypothetical protein
MKLFYKLSLLFFLLITASCDKDDFFSHGHKPKGENQNIDFQYKSSIQVGGEGASEISAYDSKTKKLFVVNVELHQISVFNISDLDNPIEEVPISIAAGSPNSVAVSKGKLAIALEADPKQNPGHILVYDTQTMVQLNSYEVGALPDMVTFSPNGQYIVSANEGEPNDDYSVDPEGSISIIDVSSGSITTLGFQSYNAQIATLVSQGFRVFGPGATLAQDVEPEYVAISQDSKTAWVTLQENNGIVKVNLKSKQIESIYPLGFKDFNEIGNEIDPSDKDEKKELNNWPVYGVYMPDAIDYAKINGAEYIITANEGDSRDYSGFGEEQRIKDVDLDPKAFPDADFLQEDENIGRLKITSTMGDIDGDGDYDELYSYGARSFTIWNTNGQMLYDSGNNIGKKTLELTPDRFNDNDGRSDDKGAEPESVEILKVKSKHLLFVGLERNDQVLVYDISNPISPELIQILSNPGDEAPEGLLAIPANESPNGKDLLVVSNEDSGTVSFYENMQD